MAERRLELGFEGGAVLRLTVAEDAVAVLTDALTAGKDVWQRVEAEEGVHFVKSSELVYVRLAPQTPGRVGFGGS